MANSEMSAPEMKELSPAPRTATTRTEGSAARSASAAGIWRHIAYVTALRRRGLETVIQPMPSFTSTSIRGV